MEDMLANVRHGDFSPMVASVDVVLAVALEAHFTTARSVWTPSTCLLDVEYAEVRPRAHRYVRQIILEGMPQAAFRFLLVGLLATSHVISAQVVQNKKQGTTSNSAPDFKALMIAEAQAIDTLDMANAARFHSKKPEDIFCDIAPLKYTGWREYQAGTQKLMSQWTSMKCVLGDDLQTHRHGGFAWGISTWHCDIVQKSGSKEGMDGRRTVIWERHGKDWLVVHEHFSVPLAPPAASK